MTLTLNRAPSAAAAAAAATSTSTSPAVKTTFGAPVAEATPAIIRARASKAYALLIMRVLLALNASSL